MSCHLSHLPREILRNIIEELLRVDDESPAGTRQDRLIYRWRELEAWSYTCTFFHDLLVPYLVEVVELNNVHGSGAWLSRLAGGKYARWVKEIRFLGWAPDILGDDEEAFVDTAGILPQSVERVLANLHLFPSLDSLSVEFDYFFHLIDVNMESQEEVEAAEKKVAWRALMAKTYQALSQNIEVNVRGLAFNNLLCIQASTFTCPSFHDFLSRVKTFSLSLQAETDEECGMWGFEKYEAFTSKLDVFFFDHLSHVTSLTIKADPLGIARGDRGRVPLALRKDQMPFLKYVHLESMVACSEMSEFLVGHTATLEHISLRECFICTQGADAQAKAVDNIYWEQLFDTICDAEFQNLRRVEILPLDVPLTFADQYLAAQIDPAQIERAREKREILNDPSSPRRLFAYAVFGRGGWLHPCVEMNHVSFERGRDQASYDKLMRKVNAIAAKARRAIP